MTALEATQDLHNFNTALREYRYEDAVAQLDIIIDRANPKSEQYRGERYAKSIFNNSSFTGISDPSIKIDTDFKPVNNLTDLKQYRAEMQRVAVEDARLEKVPKAKPKQGTPEHTAMLAREDYNKLAELYSALKEVIAVGPMKYRENHPYDGPTRGPSEFEADLSAKVSEVTKYLDPEIPTPANDTYREAFNGIAGKNLFAVSGNLEKVRLSGKDLLQASRDLLFDLARERGLSGSRTPTPVVEPKEGLFDRFGDLLKLK